VAGEAVGLLQVVEDLPALAPVPHELPVGGVFDQSPLLLQELRQKVGGEAVSVDGAEGLVWALVDEDLGVSLTPVWMSLSSSSVKYRWARAKARRAKRKKRRAFLMLPPHRTKAGHSSTTAPLLL
jgi:hypothetical protein